jgi:hypothetical protein
MTSSRERRRRVRRILAILAVVVAALILHHALLLDFPSYVRGLRRDHVRRAVVEMNDVVDDLAEGRVDDARERTEELRARMGSSQRARERMSDPGVEEVAELFASVELLQPARQIGDVLPHLALGDPSSLESYRRGVERMASLRGWYSSLVVALNAWRMDDARLAYREELRPDAEAQLDALTLEQREAVDRAWREHGVALMSGLLRVHRTLAPARVRRALRSIADRLVADLPDGGTLDEIRDRLHTLRWEQTGLDELEDSECDLGAERVSPSTVLLGVECAWESEEADALTAVSVEASLPGDEGVESDSHRAGRLDAQEVLEALADHLRRAGSEGELPDHDAAAFWLGEAHRVSGCEIVYEPLGLYETAELVAICDGRRFTHTVVADGS